METRQHQALRTALEAITAALRTTTSLGDTIARLESGLRDAFGAARVEIRLYLDAGFAAPDPDEFVLPLTLDGESIGDVAFAFAGPPETELAADARSLMGAVAATVLWRLQSDDRKRLRKIARTDTLTGLANRLAFDERLETAMRDCSDRELPLALTFLDIDFFKAYNDAYGHVAGDDCLRDVARLLARHIRPDRDLIARYGGEEFALISEGSTEAQAIETAENIAAVLAELSLPHSGSSAGRVTLSAGISGRVPTIADSASDLMRDADRALYRAKMLGRNRVAANGYASNAPIVTRQNRHLGQAPPFENETIGREADIARVATALRNARMITLVGPAGIGKSRLARAIGFGARGRVPDGVAYVDLSVLDASSDPLATLGAALDTGLESGSLLDSIVDLLRDRTMLLILDDAESPDPRVKNVCERLLDAAPGLSILATSRRPLGCGDERVVVVPPLGAEAALELLRARAGSSSGGDGDALLLRRIVERTGGVPAAIERVARHVVAHGAAATLQRLH